MADDSSSQSFLRRHWEEYKEFWGERFSFLDNFSRFVDRDQPLPSWSASDLKTAREAVNYDLSGSVIGAVSTAGVVWKYSRSLHGAGLLFVAGGIFGWTFEQEIAGHALELYRLDTLSAQTKFLEWWENKCEKSS
ncbi:hypothetical protein UlMin_030040 [Ulmus minor]